MSTAPAAERGPRVYVVYKDTRKDMSPAEKYGQLIDMFAGRVHYDRCVEQARKMLANYRDGDYIMMVGDPALCSVVCSVALEYSEADTLKLLRWDRDEIEYKPLELYFGEPEPAEVPEESIPGAAQVQRRNRWAS